MSDFRSRTRWIRSLGLLFILFSTSACALFAGTESTSYSEIAAETDDVDVLEGYAEIDIPDGALDLHGFVDGFREVTTYVRFTIAPSDVDDLIGSTHCDTAPVPTDVPPRSAESYLPEWWDLDQASQLASCIGRSEHIYQQVFLATSKLGQVDVYVVGSTQ